MWDGRRETRHQQKNKVELYLGLGSNQGDRALNIEHAVSMLNVELKTPYKAISSLIETEPWGFESKNLFCNCVVEYATSLSPLELLDITESIEKELGRTIKSNNGIYHDRIIDIDILLYGKEIIRNERLTIPHPLMQERDFVLNPLCEIASQVIHPVFGKSIAKIKAEKDKKIQE